MKETYKPEPLEYFHDKIMQMFHRRRQEVYKGSTVIKISGSTLNDIVANAKILTYNEYPELNKQKS